MYKPKTAPTILTIPLLLSLARPTTKTNTTIPRTMCPSFIFSPQLNTTRTNTQSKTDQKAIKIKFFSRNCPEHDSGDNEYNSYGIEQNSDDTEFKDDNTENDSSDNEYSRNSTEYNDDDIVYNCYVTEKDSYSTEKISYVTECKHDSTEYDRDSNPKTSTIVLN